MNRHKTRDKLNNRKPNNLSDNIKEIVSRHCFEIHSNVKGKMLPTLPSLAFKHKISIFANLTWQGGDYKNLDKVILNPTYEKGVNHQYIPGLKSGHLSPSPDFANFLFPVSSESFCFFHIQHEWNFGFTMTVRHHPCWPVLYLCGEKVVPTLGRDLPPASSDGDCL